jgi:hypothetical protein
MHYHCLAAAVARALQQIVLAALEQMSRHTAAAATGGATPYSAGHSTAFDEATVSTDTVPNSPNRYVNSRYSPLYNRVFRAVFQRLLDSYLR